MKHTFCNADSITIRLLSNNQIEPFSAVLTDAVGWMNVSERVSAGSQWSLQDISIEALRERYAEDEIYVAFAESTGSDGEVDPATDRPVACVVLQQLDPIYWPEETHGDSAFLHKLAVIGDYRAMGIPRLLVEHLIQRSRQLGKTYLRLDCRLSRPKLCQYYANLGFQPVRQLPVQHQQGIDIAQLYVMEL